MQEFCPGHLNLGKPLQAQSRIWCPTDKWYLSPVLRTGKGVNRRKIQRKVCRPGQWRSGRERCEGILQGPERLRQHVSLGFGSLECQGVLDKASAKYAQYVLLERRHQDWEGADSPVPGHSSGISP